MLSYYVIYYEKFRKVMKRTEKVALNGPKDVNLDQWMKNNRSSNHRQAFSYTVKHQVKSMSKSVIIK